MRRKYLSVSTELMLDVLKNPNVAQGTTYRVEGIPADMRIVGCELDSSRQVVLLTVESSEFELVGVDAPLSYLVPKIFHSRIAA